MNESRAFCRPCKVSFPARFTKCMHCDRPLKTEESVRTGPFQDAPAAEPEPLFDVVAIQDLSVEPQFQHDCNQCVFMGQYDGHDLYVCRAGHNLDAPYMYSVIARNGDDGPEYSSCMVNLKQPLEEYPWNPHTRVAGLIARDLEGPVKNCCSSMADFLGSFDAAAGKDDSQLMHRDHTLWVHDEVPMLKLKFCPFCGQKRSRH